MERPIPTNKDKMLFLYRNNLLTDCAFVVGEGKEKKVFRAHKFVITLVSAVFETMIYGSVGQDTENIRIPDVDPEVFQTFLDAIYLEDLVPRSFKEACYLLDLASKYMIQGMKDQCLSYMARNITPSTAATGFQALSLFGHADLASSCWKVIQEETSQVLTSEDLTDLGKETLVRILDEDRLAVESEVELVSAVERWVDADLKRQGLTEETDKLALLSEFLPHIRFISMSVKEFLSFPARKAIFSWEDHDSILNRIGNPESTAILPPNFCSKRRVFLPKKGTRPAPTKSHNTARSSTRQVPLPGDWKQQLERAAREGDVGGLQAAGADLSVSYRDKTLLHVATGAALSVGYLEETLLHVAAGEGHAKCVQWLLEQGLSPHSTAGGWTDLHSIGVLDPVWLLLGVRGGRANPCFKIGSTPLHYAARRGRLETVRLLLDCGADPAARDHDDRTPLHWAAWIGVLETVRLLLYRGANPAARDSDDRTSLHWAAWRGVEETVRLLLYRGADPAARDSKGRTPLNIAISNRHSAVADLLRRRT